MEPFGTEYNNFLWGTLCAVVANFSQVTVKENGKPKAFSPKDFIPDFITERKAPEEKKQTVEEMKTALMAIAQSANKANKKRKKR